MKATAADWASTVLCAIATLAIAAVLITALHKGWKPWE